ncbi:MAG: hypothetical protein A2005_05740 [Desulfuromonadales bacterium GWC2_61_20]|nr:MAG: hypothetical protein A2005_05740 [Desulfuromonadales bacterium GWC2_61_20]HAD04518.1 DNA mismatch repair endonuclease MutL [Desulfuromonas sp.]
MAAMIKILSEQLCNQIAAGEVVERPASVVKELVENALDACAATITIETENGGRRLIRVIDDGDGMGREDLLLSLERHATSKIRQADDLARVSTLGFRGEALPSIAAVSRFLLRSRDEASESGWEVHVEGGRVRKDGAVGAPRGTTIEVRDLFYNLPARRKFLRSDETELGHIGDLVTRLALANPEVQFRLFHQGRGLLDAPRHARLEERIATLLGRPLLKELIAVDGGQGEGLGLRGFVSSPEGTRATTGAIYTYINGRFIRDRVVQHAVMEGYRHLLPKGRYPVAVLFLTIDPADVDVNVHPTKQEVRFREQRQVHDFIATTLRRTLAPSPWVAPVAIPPEGESVPPPRRQEELTFTRSPFRGEVRESLPAYGATAESPAALHFLSAGPLPPADGVQEPAVEGYFSSLYLIGQFRHSYLLLQDGDDLILLDQHAAHERIGFERLRSAWELGKVETQALLFPNIIKLDFREAAHLAEHLAELTRFGFDIEHFGGNDFVLKGLPGGVMEAQGAQLVRDVAAEMVVHDSSGLAREVVDRILLLMACHGMIRANQHLAVSEMRQLLHDLDTVAFKSHCPHGRPVSRRITLGEVERMFKRG